MRLENGLRVMNFSSPHPFVFTTGEVLTACDEDRARRLMLSPVEIEHQRDGWTDIELSFLLTPAVEEEIDRLNQDDSVDIVLVPLPVLQALKQAGKNPGKCRVCRVADRVAKTIHPDKFCV